MLGIAVLWFRTNDLQYTVPVKIWCRIVHRPLSLSNAITVSEGEFSLRSSLQKDTRNLKLVSVGAGLFALAPHTWCGYKITGLMLEHLLFKKLYNRDVVTLNVLPSAIPTPLHANFPLLEAMLQVVF